MPPYTVVGSHTFGSHLLPQSNSKIKQDCLHEQKVEGLWGFGFSCFLQQYDWGEMPLESDFCIYSWFLLTVSSFTGCEGGYTWGKMIRLWSHNKLLNLYNNCLICITNILYFCFMRNYCSSVNMILTLSQLNYLQFLKLSQDIFKSPGSGYTVFGSSLVFASCGSSSASLLGGNLRPWKRNQGWGCSIQLSEPWISFVTVLPKWAEKRPPLSFF